MKLWLLVFLLTLLAYGQGPTPPVGYVSPYAMVGVGPNGFARIGIDSNGNLNVTGSPSGVLVQIGGYIQPIAPVALDSSGAWHYLLVDSSGNLETVGSGGTPGSPSTSVQFNNAGAFGGDAALEWNNTLKALSLDNTTSGAGTGPAFAIGVPLGNPVFAGGFMLTGSPTIPAVVEVHNSFSVGANFFAHSNTNFRGPAINLYRSEGTQASPTHILSGDAVGYTSFLGYDGSAYASGCSWEAQTGTAWTTSIHSLTLYLSCAPAQSIATNEVFRLNSTSDNGGDINGNISRLSFYVNKTNKDTSVVQFLGFMSGDTVCTACFQNSSGVDLLLGNGTANDTSGSLSLTRARTVPVLFSALVVCSSSTEGSIQAVTNSATTTWGATISSTGTNHVLAYCDGTNWTVMAQ